MFPPVIHPNRISRSNSSWERIGKISSHMVNLSEKDKDFSDETLMFNKADFTHNMDDTGVSTHMRMKIDLVQKKMVNKISMINLKGKYDLKKQQSKVSDQKEQQQIPQGEI